MYIESNECSQVLKMELMTSWALKPIKNLRNGIIKRHDFNFIGLTSLPNILNF